MTFALAAAAAIVTSPSSSLTSNGAETSVAIIRLSGNERSSVGNAVTRRMSSAITSIRTRAAGPWAGDTMTPRALRSQATFPESPEQAATSRIAIAVSVFAASLFIFLPR